MSALFCDNVIDFYSKILAITVLPVSTELFIVSESITTRLKAIE